MIFGQVAPSLEPHIRLKLRGPGSNEVDVDAQIDTAYDGALSVPMAVVTALNLTFVTTLQALVASGSSVTINVFEASVFWNGAPRRIEVECTPGHCSLGTALLAGHDLRVRFVAGAPVEIEAVP